MAPTKASPLTLRFSIRLEKNWLSRAKRVPPPGSLTNSSIAPNGETPDILLLILVPGRPQTKGSGAEYISI